MTHQHHLIYQTAGRPALLDKTEKPMRDVEAMCCVCGAWSTRTAPSKQVLGDSFTDRSLFHGFGDRVCGACAWAVSGKGTASLRPWAVVCIPGKELPPHAEKAQPWIGDTPGLCLTTRANPLPVTDTLTRPPDGEWFVSVPTSGQKHIVPYGTVNRGGGSWTVRFETANVTSTPVEFQTILNAAAYLRALGHRGDDIHAGTPTLSAVKTPADIDAWREHADQLTPYTGSPVILLALWAITKGTIDEYT